MRYFGRKPVRVYFVGDSICVGQHVSIHAGWVTKISSSLEDLSVELGVEVTVANASANGRTTRQALETLPYEVQSHRPDIAIVQYGMNDCNYWDSDHGVPRVSELAFKANLLEILERCERAGAQRLFLNTNHPTGLTEKILAGGISFQESNKRYNEAIREVAGVMSDKVTLLDIEHFFEVKVSSGTELLDLLLPEPDLLHVSKFGHNLYYDAVAPKVLAAVSEILSQP